MKMFLKSYQYMLIKLMVLSFAMVANSAPAIQESSKVLIGQLSRQLSRSELTESPRIHMNKAAPTHVTVREGESVTLECNAVGVPAPVIYWRKDGRRMRQASGDNEANLFEKLTNIGSTTVESASTIGRLHLDCVQPSMAGVYECVADNGFKKVANKTVVVVLPRTALLTTDYNEDTTGCLALRSASDEAADPVAIAPRIFLFTEWRFEKQGNNVQLFCRANGMPRPTITWMDENSQPVQTGPNVSILSNGDLFLRNVQQMGQFYCVASNSAGEAQMDTFLYVTKANEEDES